jgi:hypothetical protein
MQESQLGLFIPDAPTVKPRRVNDKAIMDAALETNLTDADICAINRVQLYLQAKTLSDHKHNQNSSSYGSSQSDG